MLSDIDMESWLRRAVFLLHFHRLSVGCLLLFRRQRFLIARALVHEGPAMRAELLSQPVGTRHAARGGERVRTGCALSRLVAMEPLVHMAFADDCTVIGDPLVDCASSSHQFPFFLCQRLQCSSTLLTSESAWVLQSASIHRSTHPPQSTQRSIRAAHTRSEKDFHACITISKPCNRNGEICSRAVCQQ